MFSLVQGCKRTQLSCKTICISRECILIHAEYKASKSSFKNLKENFMLLEIVKYVLNDE